MLRRRRVLDLPPAAIEMVARYRRMRVGRPDSARWCLRLLDGLADLAADQGRFDPDDRERQLGDLLAVVDRAREFYRAVCGRGC